jgi:hypothetical protein
MNSDNDRNVLPVGPLGRPGTATAQTVTSTYPHQQPHPHSQPPAAAPGPGAIGRTEERIGRVVGNALTGLTNLRSSAPSSPWRCAAMHLTRQTSDSRHRPRGLATVPGDKAQTG